jgi:hypothetical protein
MGSGAKGRMQRDKLAILPRIESSAWIDRQIEKNIPDRVCNVAALAARACGARGRKGTTRAHGRYLVSVPIAINPFGPCGVTREPHRLGGLQAGHGSMHLKLQVDAFQPHRQLDWPAAGEADAQINLVAMRSYLGRLIDA